MHADVKKKEDGDEESSAEESRIGTTRKRTTIDPFEVAGKKKKKRRREADEKEEAPNETDRQPVGESATGAVDATTGPTPKKRKRKKKSLLPEGEEHDGELQAANTHNAIAAHILEEKKPLQQELQDGVSEASDTGMLWLVLQRSELIRIQT